MQALKDPDNNIGVWLQNAGYRTAYVGKYLNGYEDWRQTHPTPLGWNRFDATTQWIYEYTRYQFESYRRPRSSTTPTPVWTTEGRPYITRAETEIMNGYIDDFSGTGHPFFLFDSLLAPHGAEGDVGLNLHYAIPEPKYANLYADHVPRNPATRSAAFLDQRVGDVPLEARAKTPADHIASTTARNQRAFLERIRSLASVDDHVAEVVQQLEDAGQLANTVFIFTSDNGLMLGEHNYTTKFLGYQESLRVPLIIAGPGFPQGVVSSGHPVTTVDVASSIVDLAGATPGRLSDGESILPRIYDATPRPFPIEGATAQQLRCPCLGVAGRPLGSLLLHALLRRRRGALRHHPLAVAGGEPGHQPPLRRHPRPDARPLRRAEHLPGDGPVQPCRLRPAGPARAVPARSFTATLNRSALPPGGGSFRVQVRVDGHGIPSTAGPYGCWPTAGRSAQPGGRGLRLGHRPVEPPALRRAARPTD